MRVWISEMVLVLLASACNWLGLPDVSVLKSRYPVVHYVPALQATGRKVRPAVRPKSSSYVTLEKTRPAAWVSLGDVSKVAVDAIIVSEDWAFYQHHGYDPNQIKEAVNKDVAEGKFARGASTITQQVAKNVFLDSEKNMARKLKELFLAVRLEETFKKNKILEVYLNVVEFGEGLFGIGPAAQFYFGKQPSELTAKEGAFLAMLLPSPKRYSQSFRAKSLTPYARKTVDSILGKMVQAHFLTEEEEEAQLGQPLSFEAASVGKAPAAPSESPEDQPDPDDDRS